MDDERFDRITRSFAAGTSRRRVVGRLSAGAAAAVFGVGRWRRGRAQESVPIGGECSALGANAECSQTGTPSGGVPAICGDNGYSRDGGYNCCRTEGGVCSIDAHCCASFFCVDNVCGGTSGGTLRSPGAACDTDAECDQSGGATVCAANGIASDGAKNCCRNAGGACTSGAGCCGGLLCTNGVCGGGSSSGGNLALGASCTATSQCSQTGGAVVCADNGIATDGSLNCCRNEGGACTAANNSASCCGGLYCVDGVCTDTSTTPPPATGRALGATCTATSECSQTGGAVVCANNGYDNDGSLNCCRNAGGACFDATYSADCCGGLYCRDGVCADTSATTPPATGRALGATCTASNECDQTGGTVVCASNGITTDGSLNCCRNAGGACTAANNSASCCGGLLCVNGTCQ